METVVPMDTDLQSKEAIEGKGLISKGKTDSFTDCFLQGKTESLWKGETDSFIDSPELRTDSSTRKEKLTVC